jgi:hypothetical protein
MFTNLMLLGIGAIAGAIGMYLIARNSPEHFMKTRKYMDALYTKAQDTLKKVKK